MAISDKAWKVIEGKTLKNTGVGAPLREYEAAMKKLADLGIKNSKDAKSLTGDKAAAVKAAKDGWKALVKVEGALKGVWKNFAKDLVPKPGSFSDLGKKVQAFGGEVHDEWALLLTLESAVK